MNQNNFQFFITCLKNNWGVSSIAHNFGANIKLLYLQYWLTTKMIKPHIFEIGNVVMKFIPNTHLRLVLAMALAILVNVPFLTCLVDTWEKSSRIALHHLTIVANNWLTLANSCASLPQMAYPLCDESSHIS